MKWAGTFRIAVVLISVLTGMGYGQTAEDWLRQAYDSNDPATAILYFSKAIESDPAYKYAYTGRAIARQQVGDLSGALEDLDKAIEISPTFIAAYVYRAKAGKRVEI